MYRSGAVSCRTPLRRKLEPDPSRQRQRGVDEQRQRVEDERPAGRWRGRRSFRDSSVARHMHPAGNSVIGPVDTARHRRTRGPLRSRNPGLLVDRGVGRHWVYRGVPLVVAYHVVQRRDFGDIRNGLRDPAQPRTSDLGDATQARRVDPFVTSCRQQPHRCRAGIRPGSAGTGQSNLVDRERASGDVAHVLGPSRSTASARADEVQSVTIRASRNSHVPLCIAEVGSARAHSFAVRTCAVRVDQRAASPQRSIRPCGTAT